MYYEHRWAVRVFLTVSVLIFIGLAIFIVWYLWPTTVVVDDRGVSVRRRGKEQFVGWGDVVSVESSKSGFGTYGGVKINVKVGSGGGGNGSVGLPGACFSTRQLEEMSSMIEKAVKRERMDLLREEGAHRHHEGNGHA